MTKAVGFLRIGLLLSVVVIGIGAAPNAPSVDLGGGPLVMRQLTDDQYRNTIRDLFGDVTIGGRFEPDTHEDRPFALEAPKANAAPGGMEKYDRMATSIATQVVDAKRRDELIPCKPANPKAADDACARIFLTKVGNLLYRRPLTDQEITEELKIAATGATQVNDFYFGMQMALKALLESPQFIFVQERAEVDPDHAGGYRLNAQSMATRLSLLLWGSLPDTELLRAAEAGELSKPDGLARQVNRMVASPRFEAGVRAYFVDMLQLDQLASLTKDAMLYPNFSADVAKQAQEQALRTIIDLLVTHNGDYRDIFTTSKTFLTPALASSYGVPYAAQWSASQEWLPVEMPKNMPSAGILTQIGFDALHSGPGITSPTLRGKAVSELILCQKIPPPPASINISFWAHVDHNVTSVREAIEAHRANPACAGCHKLMDPLGLALENYDTSGAFRTEDAHKPIDASGVLDDANFKDAAGLGNAIHDSPLTTSCLVNRVYTYATGRAETANEKDWVKSRLLADWSASGYKIPALMKRITLDPGFYRVTLPQPLSSGAKTTTVE